jgi:hypothetical protein
LVWSKKEYWFLATIAGLLCMCGLLYFWRPSPRVGLEFEASKLGWMKPDFGMPNDLKMMGFKNPSKNLIGMATYDMLMGWLRNVGDVDAANVEIKVPCDGTLSIMRVSGWPDNPKLISKSEAIAIPDRYIPLGDLRADDPPFLLTLYAGPEQAKNAKFRFKQGEVTKTVSYVVKRDISTGYIRIVPEILWGMDAVELRQFARNCGIVIFIVGVLGYWQRRRAIAAFSFCWDSIVRGYRNCRTHSASATNMLQIKDPAANPAHAGAKPAKNLTPKQRNERRKRNRHR